MTNRQEGTESQKTPPTQRSGGIHAIFNETAASTYNDITTIIEAKIELLKIEMTEKIAVVSSMVILGVILIIGVAYLLTTLALLSGELLGHPFLGYLLVGLVFLSGFLFFSKARPLFLKNMIQNILLSVHDYKK